MAGMAALALAQDSLIETWSIAHKVRDHGRGRGLSVVRNRALQAHAGNEAR